MVGTTTVTGGGAAAAGDVAPEAIPDRPPLPPLVLRARIVFGVLLAAVAVWVPYYFEAERVLLVSEALYIAVAAMGLNLLTGFNGQVSIGHGAFFGVGAFTSAILMDDYGWTFETTLLPAALLTGVIGLLVGFPALRVRGIYLALVTLGLAILLPPVLNKYVDGAGGIPLLTFRRSEDFSSLLTFLEDDQWAYFVCLTATVVLFVAARNLVNTRVGRAMVACRDQELAATTVGVNLAATKVGTFAISAAYAGIAGSLSVMVDGQASGTNPAEYFQHSIEFLVAIVIGGTATILGPLVGAFLLVALDRNTRHLIEDKEVLSPALFGAALIATVYVLPDGVVGGVRRLMARVGRRQPAARASQPPVQEPT